MVEAIESVFSVIIYTEFPFSFTCIIIWNAWNVWEKYDFFWILFIQFFILMKIAKDKHKKKNEMNAIFQWHKYKNKKKYE